MKQILCFCVIVLLGGSIGSPISLINTVKAATCPSFTKGTSTTSDLTIKKAVTNNSGGSKVASDFTIHIAGPNVSLDIPGSVTGCTVTLEQGIYTITEAALPSGYTGTISAACNGPNLGQQFSLVANIPVTCTITNEDNAPKLTLNKVVINDNGGTQPESAWTLTANGGAAGTLTGSGKAGSTDVVSGSAFQPGTYSLSESGPAGYSASLYSCVKNNGAPVLQNSITLAQSDTATCTITNNDMSSTLAVIKKIINDDGRNAILSSFTPLKVNSTEIMNGTVTPINAGTYFVTETTTAGYTATFSGACDNTGKVILAPGEAKTCTITNNDAVIECPLPLPNPWTIITRCTLTSDATAPGDVIVQSGAVLTISPNRLLDINFALHHLLVQSGGGVLIKAGGKIF